MAHELPRPDAMLLSRAWVCGSSLAVIAGPKPAGVWMSLVSVDCCVLSGRYLFRGIPLGSPGILVMGSRIKLLGKSNFEYH